VKPKLVSIKLIKPPQTIACTSVVTATTNSTQFLTTTAPLDSILNKINSSIIQPQTIIHKSPSVTVPVTSTNYLRKDKFKITRFLEITPKLET